MVTYLTQDSTMALETLYTLLSSGILLGFFYLYGRTTAQILNPGVIYALFWSAYLAISALCVPSLAVPVVGIIYLQFAALFVFLGSQLGVSRFGGSPVRPSARGVPNAQVLKRGTQIFYALLAVFLSSLYLHWRYQGMLLSDYATNYFATVLEVIGRRYAGQIQANPFQALFLSILYPISALGGMLVGWRVRTIRLISVMSFVPGAILLFGEGNKGALPVQVFMFFGGILGSRLRLGDDISRLRLPKLTTVGFVGAALSAAILLGFAVRGIDIFDDGDVVVSNLLSYTVTHPFAFSDWVSRYLGGESSLHYYDVVAPAGYYTFTPLFNLFGVSIELPEGTYAEYFSHGELLAGNVYTMYRGLILDFGVAGSLLAMTLLGLVFGQIFRQCRFRRWAPVSATLYCFSFGFLQQSTVVSFAMYTSFYVGILVLTAIVGVVLSFERTKALRVP